MDGPHPTAVVPPPPPPVVGREPIQPEVTPEQADEPRRGSLGLGAFGQWLESAPAWLASGMIHLAVLILFALLAIGAGQDDTLRLTMGLAEDLGDQQIEENLDLTDAPEIEVDQQLLSPDVMPDLTDPITNPPELAVSLNSESLSTELLPTTPGAPLSGRSEESKAARLLQFGGTQGTEDAVLEGLKWLSRNQLKDGGWSLTGKYSAGAPNENREAATAMALLAFQGAGKLPTSSRSDFGREVYKGWNWLLERQNADGSFFRRGGSNHRFYTDAQCTIALCELLAMTEDEQYREPATRAVNYLIATQSELGGWKYHPKQSSDLSVTGWVLMALKSARMAGIEVPSPVFSKIEEYLDEVARSDSLAYGKRGSRYVYEASDIFNREAIPTMTAVGLLCREYLGWPRDEKRLTSGIEFLLTHKPEWRRGKTNLYYWYYATQVILHAGGPNWPKWNLVMRELLPKHQIKTGKEKGSWDPGDDLPWGASGGRLYTTCLAIYTLEVYYRHLPLYQQRATR